MPSILVRSPRAGGASAALLFALILTGGCSSKHKTTTTTPPPTSTSHLACLFSYGCPTGTYCDLKECVQDCNASQACSGGLVCTSRGRCSTSATDPGDPAATTSAGILATTTQLVSATAGQTSVSVHLSGKGLVRYRMESNAAWLVPTTTASTFTDQTDLTIPVDPTKVAGSTSGTLHVVSTQGDVFIVVRATPEVQGVWRGSIAYTGVVLDTQRYPVDLGETSVAFHIRTDGAGLRAQIDAASSTLWPAPASGAASGVGTQNADGTMTFVIGETLDSSSAAPLYPSISGSVFQPKTIARQLTLTVKLDATGRLSGAATEQIYGLTSAPVVVSGTVSLGFDNQTTVATFDAAPALVPPANVDPGPGTAPIQCPPSSNTACASSDVNDQWSCLTNDTSTPLGQLPRGYLLSNFYDPSSSRTPAFTFTTANTSGNSTPYNTVSTLCSAEVPADPRSDAAVSGSPQCVDLSALACARYLSATAFPQNPELASQGSLYVARAYLELFEMLGNEELVQAAQTRLSSTATPSSIRTLLLSAHADFDAGLYHVFDPHVFEPLRATSVENAQAGPIAPYVTNDRVPLRLAAGALQSSDSAVQRAFQIDLITATDVTTMHTAAQANAVLVWLEVALLADLDARWRTPTSNALPEVVALGTEMRTIEANVVAVQPGATPLGIASTYVPLLARTSSADVETNYERIFAIAQGSVANSVAADATALASQRTFDHDASTIVQGLQDDMSSTTSQLSTICGASFVNNGVPLQDIDQCGALAGSARDSILAVNTAFLDYQSATQALSAQESLVASRTNEYAQIHNLNAGEIHFVTSTDKTILDLNIAQTVLQAAADVLSAVSTIDKPWQIGPAIGAGVAQAAADALGPPQLRLQQMQQEEMLKIGSMITDLQDAEDLYEASLQFAQLDTQVSLKLNEYARSLNVVVSTRQGVAALLAKYNTDAAALTRTSTVDSDPSFRIERNTDAIQADVALLQGKHDLYLAARALEYETNSDLSNLTNAVFLAPTGNQLQQVETCISNAWNQWRLLVSSTNSYVTEVSLAKDVLGITGPITDPVTGATIDAGTQFRRYLFDQPYAPDGAHSWPAIRFSTTLDRTNGLFSTLVCNDKITGLEAQLVGTKLTGMQREVQVLADGSSKLRSCAATATEDALVSWNLRPQGQLAPAVLSAGVNAYSTTAGVNQSLLNYAVAQDTMIVALPDSQSSPANGGLDTTQIDDILLRVTHAGVAAGSATSGFHPTCN